MSDGKIRYYLMSDDGEKIGWSRSADGIEKIRKTKIGYANQYIRDKQRQIDSYKNVLENIDSYGKRYRPEVIQNKINSAQKNIDISKKRIQKIESAKVITNEGKMPFEQAFALMRNGEKVRRMGWANYEYIYIDNDKILCQDKTCSRMFSDSDIMAVDWEVAPDNIDELVPKWMLPQYRWENKENK